MTAHSRLTVTRPLYCRGSGLKSSFRLVPVTSQACIPVRVGHLVATGDVVVPVVVISSSSRLLLDSDDLSRLAAVLPSLFGLGGRCRAAACSSAPGRLAGAGNTCASGATAQEQCQPGSFAAAGTAAQWG